MSQETSDILASFDWIETLAKTLVEREQAGLGLEGVREDLFLAYTTLAKEIQNDPRSAWLACGVQAEAHRKGA